MRSGPATRFTVSLPNPLMRTLDHLRTERSYNNRSEFVRDPLRAELGKEEWVAHRGETVGVLTPVYNHDTHALADQLTKMQHRNYRTITAAFHVHLDRHRCMVVIVLRGSARHIRGVAHNLLATKGVRNSQLD